MDKRRLKSTGNCCSLDLKDRRKAVFLYVLGVGIRTIVGDHRISFSTSER
jgi:hypothetical protein